MPSRNCVPAAPAAAGAGAVLAVDCAERVTRCLLPRGLSDDVAVLLTFWSDWITTGGSGGLPSVGAWCADTEPIPALIVTTVANALANIGQGLPPYALS